MQDIIKKEDGNPFKTERVAKSKQTMLGKLGIDTVVVPVENGFVLEVKNDKPTVSLDQMGAESEDTGSDRRPKRQKRPKRIPLGSQGPLYIAEKYKDPNYETRVVNDKPGRIEAFKKAGYEMVCVSGDNRVVGDPHCGKASKLGTPVRINIGENEFGYLMRQRKEWYDEDQVTKTSKRKEHERQLMNLPKKDEGQYGEIKIGS